MLEKSEIQVSFEMHFSLAFKYFCLTFSEFLKRLTGIQ